MVMSAKEKARRAAEAAKAANPATPDVAIATAPAVAALAAKAKVKIDTEDPLGAKIQSKDIAGPAVREQGFSVGDRTVIVVSKMPRGLYLQLNQFIDMDVKVVGGGVEKRKQPMRVGHQVRIKPTVLPFGTVPNYTIESGFSFTEVDANFWNDYYQQNKNLELITSGLLCAFKDERDAKAYCREYAALKTGLEPIAQVDDPRIEHSTNLNVSDVEIDTDAKRPAA